MALKGTAKIRNMTPVVKGVEKGGVEKSKEGMLTQHCSSGDNYVKQTKQSCSRIGFQDLFRFH